MMTLVVVLLGMMAGLAWFLPVDKVRDNAQEEEPEPDRLND
jgi:hypothetical protein